MFIECVMNNGTDYLRVIDSFSYTEGDKRKLKRRVVKNIGPLSRFDDGKPDYLKRLRLSFKEGRPIIDGLDELVKAKPIVEKVTVEFTVGDNASYSEPKNCGYFILDSLYDRLGIYEVLNKHKSQHKLDYDLNGCMKLLAFGRLLNPDSKYSTYTDNTKPTLKV